ncbi:MAG: pyruvate kinase, partial [Gammaproteobacteria bacterium]
MDRRRCIPGISGRQKTTGSCNTGRIRTCLVGNGTCSLLLTLYKLQEVRSHKVLRRTKLIATRGPATDKPGMLEKLFQAGTDVVRMNYSHQTHAHHEQRTKELRELSIKY